MIYIHPSCSLQSLPTGYTYIGKAENFELVKLAKKGNELFRAFSEQEDFNDSALPEGAGHFLEVVQVRLLCDNDIGYL